jgi:hypothetical protein
VGGRQDNSLVVRAATSIFVFTGGKLAKITKLVVCETEMALSKEYVLSSVEPTSVGYKVVLDKVKTEGVGEGTVIGQSVVYIDAAGKLIINAVYDGVHDDKVQKRG